MDSLIEKYVLVSWSKFKEYDKERKEYYANTLVELEQLKSYIKELEESEDMKIANLRNKIKAQKAAIKYLTQYNNVLKSKLEKYDNFIYGTKA